MSSTMPKKKNGFMSVVRETIRVYTVNEMSVYAGYTTLYILMAMVPLLTLVIGVVNLLPDVSLQHVEQIKRALGIAGVRSSAYSWRFRADGENRGAQIDLVIDRDDGVVNLCEMKYSSEPYEITSEEAERLKNRKQAFIRETGTRKTCRTTLVTSSGLKPGKYRWTAESEVSLDDLFSN